MLKKIKRETDIITNVDLFNEIVLRVKESESWPDKLIEYASANNHDKVGLYNYEFDPHFVLKPGGSEGYYLDLGIYGNYTLTDSVNILNLGTIKTLEETEDGIRQMAVLFVIGKIWMLLQEKVSIFISWILKGKFPTGDIPE